MIQQIVDLLDTDSSLKPGQAIEQIAKKIGKGDWKRYWERLRKRWRSLEEHGQLPKPQNEDVLQERIAEGIRGVYRQVETDRLTAKEDLVSKEKEAESIGLLPEEIKNLADTLAALEEVREQIGDIIHQPVEQAAFYYKREGIDVEDAVARHLRYHKHYGTLEKQISILREIRALRRKAGLA